MVASGMAKTLHELELEITELRTNQAHIRSTVDSLHLDMKDVKKAVFQAKWILVGGIVFGGFVNIDALLRFVSG